MGPAELSVERDALLQGGRTPEEVDRMQRNADGETERLLAAWAERVPKPWTDHACVECIPAMLDRVPWGSEGWLCLWHRGRQLLSHSESPSGASAPRTKGGT